MYCKNCGNEIKENCTYCPKCGIAQKKNMTDMQSGNYSNNYKNNRPEELSFSENWEEKRNFCVICGREIPGGYKLCPSCSEKNRKKGFDASTKIIIILSVMISIVAIVLTALVILKDRGNVFPSDDAETVLNENDSEEIIGEESDNDEDSPEETKKPTKSYESYESYYPITWTSAQALAESEGGYIAVANSKEEFERLCQIADEKGLLVFWMGVKRVGDDWNDVYCQDGGKYLPYAEWLVTKNGREPSLRYNGVEERYLMALKTGGKWYFNDAPNDVSQDYSANNYRNKISFIIEKDE